MTAFSMIIHIGGAMARVDKDWQARVKRILKAELTRRDISYRELAERLQAIGVKDSERNISNKISRGGFTAAFLIQVMDAIGCHTLHLDSD
jgi:hypothetical protein